MALLLLPGESAARVDPDGWQVNADTTTAVRAARRLPIPAGCGSSRDRSRIDRRQETAPGFGMGRQGNSDTRGSAGSYRTSYARLPEPLPLECGLSLPKVTLAYETYGTLAPDRGNTILACHALSGDAHAAGWSD